MLRPRLNKYYWGCVPGGTDGYEPNLIYKKIFMTAHVCVHITVHNCHMQHSTEKF